MREKLIELLETVVSQNELLCYGEVLVSTSRVADHLIANGVTVQKWIPVNEPPKENGYYLCVVCFSAIGERKKYRRKILYWEDNVWIEMANCFKTYKPLYWTQMPELPKGE